MALQYHPGLAHSRGTSQFLTRQVGTSWLSTQSLCRLFRQQTGSGNTVEQRGVVFGQEFVRGNKLDLNRAVVQQEIQQAEQHYQRNDYEFSRCSHRILRGECRTKRLNLSQEILQKQFKSPGTFHNRNSKPKKSEK